MRGAGLGEGRAAATPREGEEGSPEAEMELRLHPTGPPGLPTPSPECGSVPHTLQQAPPLRRHLGRTPAGAPASRQSRREGRLERPEAGEQYGAAREHAPSATTWLKWGL